MSEREKEIYAFIIRYKMSHDGNSPSIREIGEAVGIGSTSLILHYLQNLEKCSAITMDGQRAISVVGGSWVMG